MVALSSRRDVRLHFRDLRRSSLKYDKHEHLSREHYNLKHYHKQRLD
ncbi:MAG: hypothetical protein ACTSU9_12360 [Promethearchaeota archaeon]